MKNTFLKAASALALTSSVAYAEGTFVGDVTLGYSVGDVKVSGGGPSVDNDTPSIRMHSTVTLTDSFDFDLNVGSRRSDLKLPGITAKVESTYVAVVPRYTFSNGIQFGAYFESSDNGIDLLPIDLSMNSYGLSLGKDFGRWDLEGYIGRTDVDLLQNLVPGGADITDFGLRGNFDVNDNFRLAGHFIYSDVDLPAPVNSVGIYSIGLGGEYLINESWGVFGSVSRQWLDENILGTALDAKGTRYSLGASYAFGNGGSGMPMVASLELSRTELDLSSPGTIGADLDEVRLGLTIPLGHKGRSTPLNSNYRHISGGGHSAISQLLGLY